jgi:hypothetical protein
MMRGNLRMRNPSFLAVSILSLVFCLSGHSQASPSLGELAREVQREKGNKPAVKTITNDDIPSASVLASSGSGAVVDPKAPHKAGASEAPPEELARLESMVNKIDSLDRAALSKVALEGVDVNFPGRNTWEQKLYAAKLVYVSEGRELIERAKQFAASAQGLQGNKNSEDPRVKNLAIKFEEIVRDGIRADASFQAVILEGRDLASQSSSR